MVSTRSSKRKPAASLPISARSNRSARRGEQSELPSETNATPVHDDPPPPFPGRSARANAGLSEVSGVESPNLKQALHASASLGKKSVHHQGNESVNAAPETSARPARGDKHHQSEERTTEAGDESFQPEVDETRVASAETVNIEPTPDSAPPNKTDSDDDAPEEETAAAAKDRVGELARAERRAREALSNGRIKRRSRRTREEADGSLPPSASDGQQQASELLDIEQASGERLPPDAIAVVESVLEEAKAAKRSKKLVAQLKKQVRKTDTKRLTKRVGGVEIALVDRPFAVVGGLSKGKGRKSAAAFLAHCMRSGPRRVSASQIAKAAAKKKRTGR